MTSRLITSDTGRDLALANSAAGLSLPASILSHHERRLGSICASAILTKSPSLTIPTRLAIIPDDGSGADLMRKQHFGKLFHGSIWVDADDIRGHDVCRFHPEVLQVNLHNLPA
jgi:hypothetical protein